MDEPRTDLPLQPEEQPSPAPAQPHPRRSRRQRPDVGRYLAILFAAAFLLLLVTMVMERRQSEEHIGTLQQNISALQSLQNLHDEKDRLTEENQQLRDQLEQALSQLEETSAQAGQLKGQLENTAAAMDWFWQIDEAYVRGSYTLCRSLIESLERQGLEEYLPTQSITDNNRYSPADRYREIRERLY